MPVLQLFAGGRRVVVKTPLKYYGGKQRLKSFVCALINAAEWRTYTECFVGGGAVFFALQEAFPNRRFVLNDKNGLIANFYEVAKTPALHRKLMELTERRGIYCQSHFNRAGEVVRGAKADDVEKAWAIFYNLTCGFAGMLDGKTERTIGIEKGEHNGYVYRSLQNKIARLDGAAAALRNAYILNHNAIDSAARFDSPHCVHYFDPPYINTRVHYEGEYTENDFAELLDFCANCAGRFVLSHFDNNEALTAAIAENGWNTQLIDRKLRFNAQSNAATPDEEKTRTEILVYNFAAPGRMTAGARKSAGFFPTTDGGL